MLRSTATFAQNSPESPLNPNELHQVLLRLYDCRSYEERLAIYEKFEGEKAQMCNTLLEAEKEKTALANKDKDIALKEAALYKALYETIRKKKAGFGCWMGRIFSMGHYRCPK